MSINVEYVRLAKRFANFKDIDSLNGAIRAHLYNKKHLLTPSAVAVFKLLARYGAKYCGCAFLKIDNIAELTGYSRRTVCRALKLLEDLKMVLRRHMMRPVSGGNGANLYVIQKYRKDADVTPEEAPRTEPEKLQETSSEPDKPGAETEIIQSSINKRVLKRIGSVYDNFKSVVYSYIPEKKLLYRLYGVYLHQTRYLKNAYSEQELLDTAIYALRTAFNRYKKGGLRNLPGYFNGVLSKCLDRLYYSYLNEAEYHQYA
ncbi:helix-turn-helix domain-containing protein [Thermoactinomyces sp. CICC 10522]|uniref:helix-turn-helix domain-containing protein n=1 Tax=Thermoactinomyces sp. CICC 10522 TaxID=2767427 RepID=UPI0018DB1052|nr:helix-turn-helix domain-containing protein [Thermoactinomyces sp. CICC 10522]MBH8603675.1 helix-turn-helix domain-containing protein [Thermoactinomyces sp. CICC 10522]